MAKKQESRKEENARAGRTILGRTLFLMIVLGFVAFVPLAVQLYNIQIVEHDHYEKLAVEQQTRDMVVTPSRGTIYDRNMKTLAMSANAETVFISPREMKEREQELKKEAEEKEAEEKEAGETGHKFIEGEYTRLIAKNLSEILDVDYDSILEKAADTKSQYKTIKTKIEKELAAQVRTFINEYKIKGVYLQTDSKRYYPYGNLASHVIGFVGTENQGLEGLEGLYESTLKGVPGRIITAKNAAGTEMRLKYEKFYDAQDGRGMVLTIDQGIQHILQKHLETAMVENEVSQGAAAIAMNVKTGEILGLAVSEGYDLNNAWVIQNDRVREELLGMSPEEYSEAARQAQLKQWRNKAVADTYDPGSTFKVITTAIALEEKVVKPDDQFSCSGSVMVKGWPSPIHCWKRGGHGSETFAKGVENSCNPVFINVGLRIGPEKFYDYMDAFGFHEKTGVDLPGEARGLFHTKSQFAKPGDLSSLATYSFGQNFTTTPMQLITAVSAVANGGNLMKPYLVKELLDNDGNVVETFEPEVVRQVISGETSRQVCDILESVCVTGTGKNAYVKGYRIAGKTGTSEKRGPDGQMMDGKYIVSFIGFAPANDPEICVLILLDEPGGPMISRSGGIMAAPVVGKIMADIMPYWGVQPQYTADELVGIDTLIPKLENLTAAEAEKVLKDKKLKYSVVGDGEMVTDQVPAANATVPNTAEVILYLGERKPDAMITVPNVSDMSPERANREIINKSLYMKAIGATASTGTSIVASGQNPAAGTSVPIGTVVEVQFRDNTVLD